MLYTAYDPVYILPLPDGHRFPMAKYEAIPAQLLYEGTLHAQQVFSPGICEDEIILLTHTPGYLRKLHEQQLSEKEQRQIGFPTSPLLTKRELVITQGTIECCHHAMREGVSLNIAGGTHHAFSDHGEGFCLLNDFAIAANYLLDKKLAEKILIIDLDVHQGNGTAAIFSGNGNVFTFSMHGQHNYPFRKEKSDLDIPLPDGTKDTAYLSQLGIILPQLLNEVKPDFAFYLSGVDILATDKYGKLNISMEGCKKRDEFVFKELQNYHIPCTVAMGGGYSSDLKLIVEAHVNTFRAACAIYG